MAKKFIINFSSEYKHANQCENTGFDHISFLPIACQQRHSDLSSFCTEACCYLGALYALQAILKAFLLPINSPPIYTNIHIDNLGVINRSSNTPFSIQQCLLPDWDIFKIRPCNSVALSLGPLRYNTSKAIRTVTQALLRPSPYQQDSIYWQMQEPTSIYRLLHFSPSTHCTLCTSEVSHQWSPHHITSNQINFHLPLWPITHLSCQPTLMKSTTGQKANSSLLTG